jgi:uroporphyrinogen-III synthase
MTDADGATKGARSAVGTIAASGARESGRVLLTRPTGENEPLQKLLEQKHLDVRVLPLLEIIVSAETAQQRHIITSLDTYDVVIVVSKPAARYLLTLIDRWWPQLPAGIIWFALGEGTAAILREDGIDAITPLQGNTSEDLLADPRLPQALLRALIVSGEQSRGLLENTMSERGIKTDRLGLYERRPCDYPEAHLQALLLRWQPDLILTLSAETLHQLVRLGHNIGYSLRQTCLVVPSERVATLARMHSDNIRILPDMTLATQADAICSAITGLTNTGGIQR